ncbi:hypothetical protein [Novosphingobium sp. JCM 18896]|uniref:hypothetical protein n=1 Tax=Novosphingobium sp. JCM 18896 TaxID=2989731 RepID=UPI0022220951|nr:hypothetical protein [Novosphingobium sp. JCM 18896]MCW1432024.1 hypothetical protein [Novosphingobium sp. JCM 18896]
MLTPSNTLASIVRQAGLEDFADAITIHKPMRCDSHAQTYARCGHLADAIAQEQVLADVAAIGFALFAAAVVGRIAVTFVELAGLALRRRRDWLKVRAAISHGGLQAEAIDG